MNTQSVIRHLLSDKESLSQYNAGEVVAFEDVKRRMFNLERLENRNLPDHHYRLLSLKVFESIKHLAGALTVGIYELVDGLLDLDGGKIIIRPLSQHLWQDLVTEMPPLLLQAAFLWKKKPTDWNKPENVRSLYSSVLVANFRYTSLPSAEGAELSDYCLEKGGFHDLHMHLNGTTELDVLWQDYLQFPDKIYHELTEGWKHEKVREQLEQESTLFTPLKFRNLLTVARRLRTLLFMLTDPVGSTRIGYSLKGILERLTDGFSVMPGDSSRNPFATLLSGSEEQESGMAIEVLMYMRVMDYIAGNPEDGTSQLFHFYLLILGLCNRLLVQQKHQNGFEQFQKVTLNGLREYTERKYTQRFFQIRGNGLKHLSFLEGRFSPKAKESDLAEMLNLVVNAWEVMNEEDKAYGRNLPKLKMVAHFIKKAESKERDSEIRHKALRIDLWQRAIVLSLLVNGYIKYGNLVTGVDAASSEFDAPPEVFAPIFRFLRGTFCNFTYHAGEDFHHLISGLRAIYEAITFTDMEAGDRIGHAVAAGLTPGQWVKAVGKELLIPTGEWLDNLIFISHLSRMFEGISLAPLVERLVPAIKKLAFEIYEDHYSLKYLEEAWLYRKYEPMLVFAKDWEQANFREVFNHDQWTEIQRLAISNDTREIMEKYHSKIFRVNYERIIVIKTNSIFTSSWMLSCQHILLRIMKEKGIVIETLPTSNLRIGHHRSFKSYHLWNWIKWQDQGESIPEIVIGTDDTGIFATNIFNEYSNIYCHYTGSGKKSKSYALSVIGKLEENSRKRRFDNRKAKT